MLPSVIDIEAIAPQETYKSDVEPLRNLNSKAGRSANRCDHRDTAHERLLQ
jgi:hypothetical protein